MGTPQAGSASQGGSREGRDRRGAEKDLGTLKKDEEIAKIRKKNALITQLEIYDIQFRRCRPRSG